MDWINHIKTNGRLIYLKAQPVPHNKHFASRYRNQTVYGVSGTSRYLFPDKYKTHKYRVGRTFNCLNVKPVGASRNK